MELSDRPCFLCNKVGHQARNCPTKVGKAHSLEPAQQVQGDKTYLGCFGEAANFTPAHRRRSNVEATARRQMAFNAYNACQGLPRGCTMGDCLQGAFLKNSYSALMTEAPDDCTCCPSPCGHKQQESEEPGKPSLTSQPKANFFPVEDVQAWNSGCSRRFPVVARSVVRVAYSPGETIMRDRQI